MRSTPRAIRKASPGTGTPSAPPSASRGAPPARPFERAWRERFRGFAITHDDDAGIAGWSRSGLETRLRHFRRVWEPRGGRWLDAGCGAGTYTRLLARRAHLVVGLDYSSLSIAKARLRAGVDVGWCLGELDRLPLRRGAFDGVLCLGVTQVLASSGPAITTLKEVVRPGGELWLDGLNGWCAVHLLQRLRRRLQGRPPHVRYESPFGLRRAMRRAGLEQVKLVWLPMAPSGWHRLQRAIERPWVRWILQGLPPLAAFLSHSFLIRGRLPGPRRAAERRPAERPRAARGS